MIKNSIIICCYNKSPQLVRGLPSLLNQNLTDTEIIIIDDGSSDNTREMVREFKKNYSYLRYIYIDYSEPRISCIPRNVGIKHACGNNIIFTEPECFHVGNTIQMIVDKLEANPNNFILAGQTWSMGSSLFATLEEDYWNGHKPLLDHPYAQMISNGEQNTKAPDSDWALTGNIHTFALLLGAFKKKVLMEINGFDEELIGYAYDDWDLFNRLSAIGYSWIIDDDIAVVHLSHSKNYGFNIYEAAEKNAEISRKNIENKKYIANKEKEWGIIE